MPFLLSFEKDKGDSTQQPGVFTGYTFSVTNFNDGWNSIIKEDFVEVSNSGTTVLLHYGITLNDELRQDIINNFWNLLAADRYTVTNLYSYNYSALNFPYYYMEADVIEKATGNIKFLSFWVKTVNGTAYGYEVTSDTKSEFQQKFPTIESIENMYSYNYFAIGKNDLIGTWQEGSGAFTQYYFVSSGDYAGMNIVVSNLKYTFYNSSIYLTDFKSVSSVGYINEKENGSYGVNEWEVITTDQNSKVSNFKSWFEAVKGGRILHLWNKQFSGEHYQLGRIN